MKNSGSFAVYFLAVITLCLFSCINNNEKLNLENKNSVSLKEIPKYTEQIFKSWLRDTLVNLIPWKSKLEKDITQKEIFIENDSLSLKIEIYYSDSITKDEKYSGEILNMIELLKENNELPKPPFRLSFNYEWFYYPSSVEQLKYDFIYEIRDIKIMQLNSITKFGFIRGRLIDK